MSPRRRTARARVIAAAAGAVVAGGMLWGATGYVSGGNGKGDLAPQQEFFVGKTAALRDPTPFLLPDASPSHRRDLYVQHLGSDPARGWVAFSAFAPDQTDRSCFLKWRSAWFEAPCTAPPSPATGTALTRYPSRLADGRLY